MLRIAREERLLSEQQVYRELIRNLAHEIRNPLGGLRGSAQLLERELPDSGLREYTQVIIKEADRLQLLLDRLLTPRRAPKIGSLNIHEALERVRSIVQAEFGERVTVLRDYDPSVPELQGDMEQLIQALLNVARNAAQAITGSGHEASGTILFRTRVLRQITIGRQRYRLALELQIVDSGRARGHPRADLPSACFRTRGRQRDRPVARTDLRSVPRRGHRMREPAGEHRF